MSSRCIFEPLNCIQHALAEEGQSMKPFGGKQMIVVGEFLQLPPVPGPCDDERHIFESSL